MPVKDHPYAVRLERLERKMVLEPLGVREAEHTAGIPMTGYDRQTASSSLYSNFFQNSIADISLYHRGRRAVTLLKTYLIMAK